MMKLLPYKYKYAGYFLTLAGIASTVFYLFFDFRFKMPVFAVVSAYLDIKIFKSFETNFADELTMFLLVAGLFLLIFSKERKEDNYDFNRARFVSLFRAMFINIIALMFSILFLYGQIFMAVIILNLIFLPSVYLILFFFEKRKSSDFVE